MIHNDTQTLILPNYINTTVCPRSLDPFYTVTYCTKRKKKELNPYKVCQVFLDI